jgi:hypothetical protein
MVALTLSSPTVIYGGLACATTDISITISDTPSVYAGFLAPDNRSFNSSGTKNSGGSPLDPYVLYHVPMNKISEYAANFNTLALDPTGAASVISSSSGQLDEVVIPLQIVSANIPTTNSGTNMLSGSLTGTIVQAWYRPPLLFVNDLTANAVGVENFPSQRTIFTDKYERELIDRYQFCYNAASVGTISSTTNFATSPTSGYKYTQYYSTDYVNGTILSSYVDCLKSTPSDVDALSAPYTRVDEMSERDIRFVGIGSPLLWTDRPAGIPNNVYTPVISSDGTIRKALSSFINGPQTYYGGYFHEFKFRSTPNAGRQASASTSLPSVDPLVAPIISGLKLEFLPGNEWLGASSFYLVDNSTSSPTSDNYFVWMPASGTTVYALSDPSLSYYGTIGQNPQPDGGDGMLFTLTEKDTITGYLDYTQDARTGALSFKLSRYTTRTTPLPGITVTVTGYNTFYVDFDATTAITEFPSSTAVTSRRFYPTKVLTGYLDQPQTPKTLLVPAIYTTPREYFNNFIVFSGQTSFKLGPFYNLYGTTPPDGAALSQFISLNATKGMGVIDPGTSLSAYAARYLWLMKLENGGAEYIIYYNNSGNTISAERVPDAGIAVWLANTASNASSPARATAVSIFDSFLGYTWTFMQHGTIPDEKAPSTSYKIFTVETYGSNMIPNTGSPAGLNQPTYTLSFTGKDVTIIDKPAAAVDASSPTLWQCKFLTRSGAGTQTGQGPLHG